eukprot:TRINITY_DN29003_c0_g1_i1.p1 TRINITY_DN29003_c0_g1~~TRINITY_DN29003_c0_g1_i1.p1  ORF type:complete len:235 (-),score=18.99 TRINITY_DN29003_c0_g1_i1:391-1095(-)
MASVRLQASRLLRNVLLYPPTRTLSTISSRGVLPSSERGIFPRKASEHTVIESSKCNRRWVRGRVSGSNSGSNYSPLGGGNWGDKPPEEIGPLFPGCDYEHWLIVMDPPADGKATKEEMIDCYVKTLAKVLGSEEAAKKSIYNVSCERYYGFGCQISEETSYKLKDVPGVVFVLPDSYVDPTHQDYGGELFVDGKIVPRSPERQRLIDAATQHTNARPRYNDRARARRRENLGR